jgi:lysozyme|tara:strand:- start:211 stop:654 length:444 start_codon:yes stop_codon:yes gene_type:complete
MNVHKLKTEIETDEGSSQAIYLDHLGYKTFGIGHLVRKDDPESDMDVGDEVTLDRITEVFESDMESVISDCEKAFPNIYDMPEEAQHIIANMMFNLGFPRFCKFSKMIKAMNERDWQEAANQMVDSRWYNQVPNRAKRLEERIRSCS